MLLAALPFAAAVLSLLVAIASMLRKQPTPATWFFFGGMTILGLDSLFTGLSLVARELPDAVRWISLGLAIKSLVPGVWLGFGLTYCSGDHRAALAGWKVPLATVALVPIGLSLGFRNELLEIALEGPSTAALQLRFGAVARLLNIVLLLTFVLVLLRLEQTFRAAVGTMRWRIKFVVLGLAVIFGGHLYVRSQAILFSVYDVALTGIESSALLIGCGFLALAYARTGFAEADVYPSRAVLRSSFTVLIVGGYLFSVGILAELVRQFGGVETFQFQAFVVLLSMAGLAVLMLSDRFRQYVHGFVGRHFRKAQHDSLRIWTGLSRRLAMVKDEAGLWASAARFVSETLNVLSVNVWLIDDMKTEIVGGASTGQKPGTGITSVASSAASDALAAGLLARSAPFDLDAVDAPWAEGLRQLNPVTFPENGGHRWCVPLTAGEKCLGAVVLADRVNGIAYSVEELELLKCMGDQITSVLLNRRLANEVVHARELDAFRTMSAFFVHDLKNAAASLNLTLQNLPVHFDNPAFRDDALRGLTNTSRRIDQVIARLSALRQRPDLKPEETDLNQLVAETVDGLKQLQGIELSRHLQPLPRVHVDRGQIQSVITNLLLNAREALNPGGRIQVSTEYQGNRIVLSVADNGCGMSAAFVRNSLFRPFQSTKKDGLGIGMFQSRVIVEAHGGSIHVTSGRDEGTTFRVSLPDGVEP